MESFDSIYLDLSDHSGKCRFADSGFAWKPSAGGGATFTLDKDNIGQAQWSRAARGYELKVLNRSSGVNQLDGFAEDDFERLSKAFKVWYGVALEHKEHALRGWNWGKGEFGKAELSFLVRNQPAFEIPYTEISNTNLAGRNEVAVDFSLPADGEDTGTNGHLGGARSKGRKAGGARDQLVEARFYIPGTVVKKDVKKEEDGEDGAASGEDGEEEGEEQNAANTWYETLVDKAEIGDVAGDTLVQFMDILHLTPRGRFDMDLYEKSFRLRGKTYDYKIQYESVKKFFLLPKPDDVHTLVAMGLEPPLRQGQTRYPFIVMQFKRDEDIDVTMNASEEDLENKFKEKLLPKYDGPVYVVLTHIFRGLLGKRVISPSKEFSSRHNQSGVKCSIKANEGHLYCMDKSLMFVPKPATYIAMDQIQLVTMSRVGGAISASRTFDLTVTTKSGGQEHQFSNINREEQQPLEDFLRGRGLKVHNEMAEDQSTILAAALKDQELESSEEDEVVNAGRGSAGEDSESADEDFQADSDSDVAEEFDSGHESSGAGDGSDAEMADGDDDADEPEEDARPPKKKAKRGD